MRLHNQPDISSTIWRPSGLPSLEFAGISYEGFHFEPHFHDHFVIMLVERGINLGRRCHEKYEVLPGEMLILQPGEIHTGNAREGKPLHYFSFYPDAENLNLWLEKTERYRTDAFGLQMKYQSPLPGNLFRKLIRVVSQEGNEALANETALLEFLDALLAEQQPVPNQKQPKFSGDSEKLKRATDFIRDQFTESFSLDQLAKASGAGAFYLIRLFRKHYGLTPFDYLRSYRIEQAKRLLQTKGKSLTEVAYQTGFYDQSHFTRCFKKNTGFLPSVFQRK